MAAKYSGKMSSDEKRLVVWTELLPGIEDFLCHVLAKEKLSEGAEELRQYFIERLDIIKLPPSLPPRPNRPTCKTPPPSAPSTPEPVREPTPIPTIPSPEEHAEFAAYQRKLARSLLSPTNSERERVKVYDDIDHSSDSDECSGVRKEQNLYEVPIDRENGCEKDLHNESESADSIPLSSPDAKSLQSEQAPSSPKPPPLPPPRAHRQTESGSRDSTCSDDRPPDLPARPVIVVKCDLQDDQTDGNDSEDGTSYESYDEIEAEKYNKRSVSLPSKHFKNRKHKTLSKSRSSSNWELNIPYGKLEDVVLSGELYYRGVLTWSRKLVAISNRLLISYKPEKDGKPSMVIQLAGYTATFTARENQRGFEIKLSHEFAETYHFAVDFKEWAETWCEYMNAVAKHSQPPGPYLHLARSLFREDEKNGLKDKAEMNMSASNLSMASSDTGSIDSTSRKKKKVSTFTGNTVIRMGSFAHRATQFFESLGKKANVKRLLSSGSDSQEYHLSSRPVSTASSNPEISTTTLDIPEINENPLGEISINIKHKGYLNIYSSFNKRKWGQRWCLIRENMFQCYRNEKSSICELDFLLRQCILQRAVEETKSELGLMILEGGIEKLTIEPLSKEEMRPWLRVLIHETATEKVPDGLMEYYVEKNISDVPMKLNTSDLSALIESTFLNFCMDTDFSFNDSRDDTSQVDTSFEDKSTEEHEYIIPGQEDNNDTWQSSKDNVFSQNGSNTCSTDKTVNDSSTTSNDKTEKVMLREHESPPHEGIVIKRTPSGSGDLYTEVTKKNNSSLSSRKTSINSISEAQENSSSKNAPKKNKNKGRKKRSKNKDKKKENKQSSVSEVVKEKLTSENKPDSNLDAHVLKEKSHEHNQTDLHLKNSCHGVTKPGAFPVSLNITSVHSSDAGRSNVCDSFSDNVCSLTSDSGDYDLVHNSTCTCHSHILSSSHIYDDVNSDLSLSFNSNASHSSPNERTAEHHTQYSPKHSSLFHPKNTDYPHAQCSSSNINSKLSSSHLSAILESCQQNVNVQFSFPLKSISQSRSASPSPSPSKSELTIDRFDDDTRPDSGIIMDGEDSSKGDNSEEALDSISRGTDASDEISDKNFTSESLLVDVDKYTDNEQLVRRIEMLRRELIDIKKKRIEVRDKRLTASNDDRQSYEEKFHTLSHECRMVTEEIDLLCKLQKKMEEKRIHGVRS